MQPDSSSPQDLIAFGWAIAQATLEHATGHLTLVTHWFRTPEDDSVNADEHFGSDERTLRFLGVALPTLVDQLEAELAVVVAPWGLEDGMPSLNVVALPAAGAAGLETRALTRLQENPGPPFWRLEPGHRTSPAELVDIVAALSR